MTTPDYKLVYNWDGAPLDYSEYPQSLEQFLEKVYAPLVHTQVDALFWNLGSHEASWPSQNLEMVGETEDRQYATVRGMRHAEGLLAMFERGENPYAALVERGRELGIAVFASIRMNDNHFYGILPEDMARTRRVALTRLRKEHPEWCLQPDQVPEQRGIGSWNFAFPQVREHRLQFISEACAVADWDGVELDWQRHAFHLPENEGYRLRYTLTDLQRAVRRLSAQIGTQRGRPFFLAVRVATTLESCRRIGYDIPLWLEEGLCDMLIGAGNSGTDPGFEVEAFQNLARPSGVKVYGGLDSIGRQQANRLASTGAWRDAWIRATASSYWARGIDGLYAFNWHGTAQTWRALLTTIGSLHTLRRTNKTYAAVHRGPPAMVGAVNDRIYGETAVTLYRTLTEEGPLFQVPVHDEVAAEAREGGLESVELHLELEHFSPEDVIELSLDGVVLEAPVVRNSAAENPEEPADVTEKSWLIWALAPEQADQATHTVQVRLQHRDPRIRPALVLHHVEININYK